MRQLYKAEGCAVLECRKALLRAPLLNGDAPLYLSLDLIVQENACMRPGS